ncbi:GYD domain-containing protein [Natrinema caseinilyticum]|uniref:GYD domain-containing protein n=1 Tax=Natrinema caseinilyticum TaxID=2961570 RepID=UPI0020C43939|nr:GYD domain-containing protein [Natrinema caseinilyticum]
MPTYITLLNWTQKGIENVEDSLDRDEAGAEIVESQGGAVKDVYYTMGPYDNVVISEFPDDESYAKAILKVESEGYITGQTLKALPEDIISEFPE